MEWHWAPALLVGTPGRPSTDAPTTNILSKLEMERDALDRLSREELLELLVEQVEVVGRQQEALAEREAAIERRDEKIRALEAELSQFQRPVKTPENSSVSPSRGQKANRDERRRGRKLGPKRG